MCGWVGMPCTVESRPAAARAAAVVRMLLTPRRRRSPPPPRRRRTAAPLQDLSEEELTRRREEVDKYTVEGDLRRFNALNIKRLKEIGCYRGRRHYNVSGVHDGAAGFLCAGGCAGGRSGWWWAREMALGSWLRRRHCGGGEAASSAAVFCLCHRPSATHSVACAPLAAAEPARARPADQEQRTHTQGWVLCCAAFHHRLPSIAMRECLLGLTACPPSPTFPPPFSLQARRSPLPARRLAASEQVLRPFFPSACNR